MKQKKLDIWNCLIVILFACFFVYGVIVAKDYGLTSDDEYQRYHSLVTYNDLILEDEEYVTQSVDTTRLPSMDQYGANYGVIVQLPTVLWEHLNDFKYSYIEVYQARHVYVFLWFFIATMVFYRLCMVLTGKNRLLSFFGVLMLIVSPRILADACYNVKDAMCLSLYIIATYFGVKFLQKDSIVNLLLFVIWTALCATTRIVGGVLIPALLMAVFCKGLYEGTWKRYVGYAIGMVLFFLAAYVLMTPKSWGDILQNLWATVKTFSNYTTWNGKVLFMGDWVRGHSLPWYYLFVWIGITIPVVYSALVIAGIGHTVARVFCLIKNREDIAEVCHRVFLLLAIAIPFVYVVLLRPTLYNGWRHFYFTYPLLVVHAVLVLERLYNNKEWMIGRYVSLALVAVSVCITGGWIVKNHPYEYVYFNPVVRDYAFSNFDLDYWGMTQVECYQYILEQDAGEIIKITSFIPSCSTNIMSDAESSRLEEVNSWDRAEWVIDDGNGFEGSEEFECVKAIEVDGHWIRSIWKRKSQNVASYMVDFNEEGINAYSIHDIVWTAKQSEHEMVFDGMLEVPLPITEINVKLISSEQDAVVPVYVTDDKMKWQPLFDGDKCSVEYVSGIRIIMSKDVAVNGGSFLVTLKGDIECIRKVEKLGNQAIVKLETNSSGNSPVKNVQDDNRKTRWEVNNQLPGTYLDIYLDEAYEISKIQLDYGSSDEDYARELYLYTSVDGMTWVEQNYTTDDHMNYILDHPVLGQYVRLQLGDTGEEIPQSWSVYELKLFTK